MNKFNLTFRGDILPDEDPAQVKTRLGELLGIEDPVKLAACFSGDTVILGRNLDRKEAADLYASLAKIGARGELVTISQRGLNTSDARSPGKSTDNSSVQAQPVEETSAPASKTPAVADPVKEAADNGAGGGTTYAVGSRMARADNPATTPARAALATATEPQATKPLRRADLASSNHLESTDATELLAREKALKKALRAKQKQAGKKARAEDKARKKAEAVAAARRAAQEKADRAALLHEQKQQEAQAAALRKEQQEQARREREEQARLQHERDEQARRDKEEQARQQREREALRKQQAAEQAAAAAAAKAAAKAEEKTRADKLAAMVKAEAAALKQQQADEITRRKAREQRLKAEEVARRKAAEAEQAAQLKAMEEQAIQRGAAELAGGAGARTFKARVKTTLDLPQRLGSQQQPNQPIRTKRQPGAPNLYTLRPFRNTPDIQARAQQSRRSMKRAYGLAAAALAGLVLAVLAIASLPAQHILTGAAAMTTDSRGHPLLVAHDRLLLLDRAGADHSELLLETLGVTALLPPLMFTEDNTLLTAGLDITATAPAAGLLRCDLLTPACQAAPGELASGNIDGITHNPLDGSIFLADSVSGSLRKVSSGGELLASAELELPPHPILHLDSGLLLVTSAEASAISVLRYEDEAFGQQLDEILIVPPSGTDPGLSRVWDFAPLGQSWWVVLYDPATPGSTAALYRYDSQWKLLGQVDLAPDSWPQQLVPWGGKMLVLDPQHIPIQRFNAQGMVEVPLTPAALQALADEQQRASSLQTLAARVGLAILGLLLVTAWLAGFGHRVRSMVYTTCRGRGAEPVDKLAASIDWVDPAADRDQRVQRTCISYALVALALLALAMGLGVTVIQLGALLLALAGPAVALLLVVRSDPGHIGVVQEQLMLVDHDDMYHLGEGPRIQYRGPFLMIDDVTVFTGTSLLPAFNPSQLRQQVLPLVQAGVRVDRRIAMVKLLQARHPMALGLVVVVAGIALAAAMLTLQGVY